MMLLIILRSNMSEFFAWSRGVSKCNPAEHPEGGPHIMGGPKINILIGMFMGHK